MNERAGTSKTIDPTISQAPPEGIAPQGGVPSSRGPTDLASYYGQPVVKEPEWTWEVPWYLWAGGAAGVSSMIGAAARATGNEELAERATLVAAAGAVASPVLLVADLGRPARFFNMLRVFKPTSAMSVGSWILAAYGTAAGGAGALTVLGWFPRLRRVAETAAAVLGPPMATYTAALVADSSIPVWHEARGELPALFAGSAAAAGGSALVLVTPSEASEPARRIAVAGAIAELAAGQVMTSRLGDLADVYERGDAGRYEKAAKGLTAVGAALLAFGGRRRRTVTLVGAAATAAGSLSQRWAVYRAGFQSAWDPMHTVRPQRERLRRNKGHRRA